ncbi:integrase [Actinacidiphila bryophytorum]|uniref:integrase n=1 Tax=Actinacidiphila bryophytorum TaxID=1436133 RepID=UPI002176A4D0|nr:integrase [Actinacidiphila bryophytorum]UWE10075.1 integrase [Actinacidiphila bryophytorum]
MRVAMASAAKQPGRRNEDFTGATPAAAVLVDGAGIPDSEHTCSHGVAWYADQLGGCLLGLLALAPDRDLTSLLAAAITQVTGLHRDTCAVTDPISPSATVAVLRIAGGVADYLVLGDCVALLDRVGAPPLAVRDLREVVVSGSYEPALRAAGQDTAERARVLGELRSRRNRPGGFWVAKDDPRAADEAVTGSLPLSELAGAALLSNGASRIEDRFRLAGWPEVLALLAAHGPGEVIDRVRGAEAVHSVPPDDATVAYCTGLAGS